MSNGNVISLFAKKTLEESKETPEETVARFHSKLDEVLDDFHLLNPCEKYEVMSSTIKICKDVFELYFNMKKRVES